MSIVTVYKYLYYHVPLSHSIFFILNSYPLYYELTGKDLAHSTENRESKGFLINLSYSPEHINLFSEVVTAMQVADGALFLVDCIKGRFSEANN